MNYNIILTGILFSCILPPGWGAIPSRNHMSLCSYNLSFKSFIFKKLEVRSWHLDTTAMQSAR